MAKKYSINSSGYAIAERDIHSLGGLVPKGSQGAKLASEDQLSQNGECWIANGDATAYGDLRVTDDAYIFDIGTTNSHLSGPVLISGSSRLVSGIAINSELDHAPATYITNSEIANVRSKTTFGIAQAPAVERLVQGALDFNAPVGTNLVDMIVDDPAAVRTAEVLVLCKKTRIVNVPLGSTASACFVYIDKRDSTLRYVGNRTSVNGVLDLSHDRAIYAMIVFWNPAATTPDEFATKGVELIDSALQTKKVDYQNNAISTISTISTTIADSGIYLETVQKLYHAGNVVSCPRTVLHNPDGGNLVLSGFFNRCESVRVEPYIPGVDAFILDNHKIITASGCPLLRLGDDTIMPELVAKRNLVLRNCIVPKAMFVDDTVNGNTYEGIDFSYANAHLGEVVGNGYKMVSAHVQGLYNLSQGTNIHGQISRPENIGPGVQFTGRVIDTPLDGSVIEQGSLNVQYGVPFEDIKSSSDTTVRTKRLTVLKNAVKPALPPGYSMFVFYFTEQVLLTRFENNPVALVGGEPYVAFSFYRDSGEPFTVREFVNLGVNMRSYDFTRVPQVTGSGLVVSGVTCSGDVQVHGRPYVSRVFDANTFEQGLVHLDYIPGQQSWSDAKAEDPVKSRRLRSKNTSSCNPGDSISCAALFNMYVVYFNDSGKYLSDSGTYTNGATVPAGARFFGIILKYVSDVAISPSDAPAANVTYTAAFKRERYVTSERDKVFDTDKLIGPDRWGVGNFDYEPGRLYADTINPAVNTWLHLKKPINVSPVYDTWITKGGSNTYNVDGSTVFTPGQIAAAAIRLTDNAANPVTPDFVTEAGLIITYTPIPRIVLPYGVPNIYIESKVRLTDNAVLGTSVFGKAITLTGDAVLGEVPGYEGDPCVCAQGEGDSNIKYP